MMLKKGFLVVVCLTVFASVSMAGVIASNDCSSLGDFTSSNPDETWIIAGGGPDSSDSLRFLSRVGKYAITWDLPQAIDLSSNVSGSEISFSFDYAALAGYTENTVFTAYAMVDGNAYPIWQTSNLTADYTAGWSNWDNAFASNSFGGLIDSGNLTGIMFYVSTGSRFLQLDNLMLMQVPEPTTIALFALASFAGVIRRKK